MSLSLALPIARCAIVLSAAALLCGCASSSAEDSFAAAPRPAPAARSTSAPPAPPPSAMVPSVDPLVDARGECWVKLDRDRRAPKDLDQRVKLVEKCVAAKMAAVPQSSAQ